MRGDVVVCDQPYFSLMISLRKIWFIQYVVRVFNVFLCNLMDVVCYLCAVEVVLVLLIIVVFCFLAIRNCGRLLILLEIWCDEFFVIS